MRTARAASNPARNNADGPSRCRTAFSAADSGLLNQVEHRGGAPCSPRNAQIDKSVGHLQRNGVGHSRQGSQVHNVHLSLASNERGEPCLHANRALGDPVFVQEPFCAQTETKRHVALVVLNFRRKVAKLAPILEYLLQATAALIRKPDSFECGHNSRIPVLSLHIPNQIFPRCKRVARIVEVNPVLEDADHRISIRLSIVLVNEQIDRRLAEGDIPARVADSLQRLLVNFIRGIDMLVDEVEYRFPGLYQIGLDDHPARPLVAYRMLVRVALVPLQVDDHPRQMLKNDGLLPQQEHRRAGGHKATFALHEESPGLEELHVCDIRVGVGPLRLKLRSVPTKIAGVEERLRVDVDRHGIIGHGAVIANEIEELVLGATATLGSFADIGPVNILVQVNRLVGSRSFGNVEAEQSLAFNIVISQLCRKNRADLLPVSQQRIELPLDLVDLLNAGDLQGTVGLAHPHDDIAASRVGECRHCR